MFKMSPAPVIEHNLVGAFLEWVTEHERILYGGTAINAILPQELKFFADLTAPDFDVLSPDASADTDLLVRVFRDLGHVTSIASDPHTNTHRVFVDGVILTRVTQIPKAVYIRLHEGALRGDNGMLVAPVEYIRMALFYELSRNDAVAEWPVAFDRLLRIDRAFGVDANKDIREPNAVEERDHDARVLMGEARTFLSKSHLVVCGFAAAAMALTDGAWPNNPSRLDASTTCIDVLSNDPDSSTSEFVKLFSASVQPNRLKIIRHRAGAVFPRHCIVHLDGRPLIGIFHADRCIAFVKVDGIRVATMDTLLAIYLRAYVMGRPTANLKVLCELLTHQQYRRYDSDKPVFKRFVTECYGEKR